MKKKVYYLGFYSIEEESNYRFGNIAALRKMDYTISVLTEANYEVNLISLSWATKPNSIYLPYKSKIKNLFNLYMPPAFFFRGIWSYRLNVIIAQLWFILICTYRIPKKSVVIVYHSPKLFAALKWIKKFKQIRIALEIGEIYGDVWEISSKEADDEKNLIALCDYFIPVSLELFKKFHKKSCFLMHGTYKIQYPLRINTDNLDIINILYAGSIDQTKAGAVTAVEIMRYLPSNYRMHIAGYGEPKQVNELKEKIKELNNEFNTEVVFFHGNLNSEKLNTLMRRCSVAVNPQNQGLYMKTAFPSKVLVYLTFQMNVVSTSIESVLNSEVANLITFVDGNKAIDFATAIQSLEWRHIKKIPDVLNRLNDNCRMEFTKLLEN